MMRLTIVAAVVAQVALAATISHSEGFLKPVAPAKTAASDEKKKTVVDAKPVAKVAEKVVEKKAEKVVDAKKTKEPEKVAKKVEKIEKVAKKVVTKTDKVAEKTEKVAEKTQKVQEKAEKPAEKKTPPLTTEHLTQKMPLEAQAQGFEGEMVVHEDGKSMVKDWRREYGPKATPKTKNANEKSGTSHCGVASAVVLAAVALHFWQ